MWYFSEHKVNPSRHGVSTARFLSSSSGWRTRSQPSVAQNLSCDQITSVALENGSLSRVWPFNHKMDPEASADAKEPQTSCLQPPGRCLTRLPAGVVGPSYRKRRLRSLHIPHDEECAPVEKGAEVWSWLPFPDWILIPDQPGNCLELELYLSITQKDNHKHKYASLFICVKQSNTSVQCKTFLSP